MPSQLRALMARSSDRHVTSCLLKISSSGECPFNSVIVLIRNRYSPARPSTGLHPRPASPTTLSPLFPDQLDLTYNSTLYPSRRGELIRDLQDRADTFIEAWTARVEEMGHKSVVVFGHAASVIALGRAVSLSSCEIEGGILICLVDRG
jgi:hypothetical protein